MTTRSSLLLFALLLLTTACRTGLAPHALTGEATTLGVTSAVADASSVARAETSAIAPSVRSNSTEPAVTAVPVSAVPAQEQPGWEFTVAPYLWLVGVSGTVGAGGSEVPVDASFSDLVENLDFGGSLFFEGRKGKWGFIVDGTFVNLSGEAEPMPGAKVDVGTDLTLLGIDAAYRASETESGSVDLLFGVRYFDFSNEIELPSPSGTQTGGLEFVDPVLGVRGIWDIGERWNLRIRTDIAGFGVGSEMTWQLVTLFGYELTEAWDLVLGYRGIGMNAEDSDASLDAQFQGVLFGAAYSW